MATGTAALHASANKDDFWPAFHWILLPHNLPVGSPTEIWVVHVLLSRFSHLQLFATLWTAAHQAPLSLGFSRQEYWSGLPCPPPGDLPNPGIEPTSPASSALQVDSLPLSHQGSPAEMCGYGVKYSFSLFPLSAGGGICCANDVLTLQSNHHHRQCGNLPL